MVTTVPESRGDSKCEKQNLSEADTVNAGKSHVDWNAAGKVQVVKNQASCGSCWAFSANGGLESAYAIYKDELPNLSEQELVDCTKDYGNYGCNGGLMSYSYDYILEHNINTSADYPYRAVEGRCKDISGKGAHGLKGCVQVQQDVFAVVKALRKQPVPIAFYVQSDFFSYSGGIYNPDSCAGHPNHAVLAYGFHFDKDANQSYFMVKNSWGAGWGDKGHFKIVMGKGKGTCSLAGTEWNYYPTL